MKFLLLFIAIIFTNVGAFSQSFYDIVSYKGDYYVISPSPSLYFNDSQNDFVFKGEYVFEDGKLFLSEVLKPNKDYKKTEAWDTIMSMEQQFVPVSDTFKLIRVDNYYKTLAMISNTGIHQSIYSFYPLKELIVNKGEITSRFPEYTANTDIEEGIISLSHPLAFESHSLKIFNDSGHVFYQIYNNYRRDFVQEYRLIPDSYNIEFEFEEHTQLLNNVKVNGNEVTYLNSYLGNNTVSYSSCDGECNTIDLSKLYGAIGLTYGNSQLFQNESLEINSFKYDMKYGTEFLIDNWSRTSFVIFSGGNYTFHNINNNPIYNGQQIKHQYYSHLGAQFGLASKIYISNYKKYNQKRAFLELGGYYNLPLIFRQISRDKSFDFKLSERWIHKFNDVRVYLALGLTNAVSITAEYMLFDIVKEERTQLPKFNFGLRFHVTN